MEEGKRKHSDEDEEKEKSAEEHANKKQRTVSSDSSSEEEEEEIEKEKEEEEQSTLPGFLFSLLRDESSEALSDVHLVTQQKTFKLHRVLLGRVPYIKCLISGPFASQNRTEDGITIIDLTKVEEELLGGGQEGGYPDHDKVWNWLFHFIYTDEFPGTLPSRARRRPRPEKIPGSLLVSLGRLARYLCFTPLYEKVVDLAGKQEHSIESTGALRNIAVRHFLDLKFRREDILWLVVDLSEIFRKLLDHNNKDIDQFKEVPLPVIELLLVKYSKMMPLLMRSILFSKAAEAHLGITTKEVNVREREGSPALTSLLKAFDGGKIWEPPRSSSGIHANPEFIRSFFGILPLHLIDGKEDEVAGVWAAELLCEYTGHSEEIYSAFGDKVHVFIEGDHGGQYCTWKVSVKHHFTLPLQLKAHLQYHRSHMGNKLSPWFHDRASLIAPETQHLLYKLTMGIEDPEDFAGGVAWKLLLRISLVDTLAS